jgi:hypothetical protein
MLDEWMSEAEAAAEIDKTVRTLRQWRDGEPGLLTLILGGRSDITARPSWIISNPFR